MTQFTLIRPVLKVCSLILLVFGLMMTVPLLMAIIYHTGNTAAFSNAIALTVGLAAGGWLLSRSHRINLLTPRQMFLITTTSWVLISLTGALPFLLIPGFCDISDAVFESVSGLTTTGSTVLTGLDTMAHDILVWRSILQWVGGLGVIGMAVAILPFLKVGGMRLFQTESSDWSDKAMPRSRTMVTMIIYVYIILTFLCTLAFMFTGMDSFHAVNHAMTTISTGGYSTSDSSFAQFADLGSHWVAITFMILGALPFAIYVHFLVKRNWRVFNDQQIRGFLLTILIISIIVTLHLMSDAGIDLLHAFTYATFNLVSVITTTGFASGDYSQWGNLAVAAFFFAMFIGGCSGSTSGGIKIFRFQLLFMMHCPRSTPPRYDPALLQRPRSRRQHCFICRNLCIYYAAITGNYYPTACIYRLRPHHQPHRRSNRTHERGPRAWRHHWSRRQFFNTARQQQVDFECRDAIRPTGIYDCYFGAYTDLLEKLIFTRQQDQLLAGTEQSCFLNKANTF